MASNNKLRLVKKEFIDLTKIKPWYDQKKLFSAIDFGENKHSAEKRKATGDPYFIHPLRVAINIIPEKDTDLDVIIASLLHDTVENTDTTIKELETNYGSIVALLVDGMTKPDPAERKKLGKEKYYENYFSKLRNCSKKDVRVLKIKLCDRIDNLTEYSLFADKPKVKNYIWESYEYLEIVKEFNLVTDLINSLKIKLKPLEDFLEH